MTDHVARERLIALLAAEPELTARELAQRLDVSRQRIYQLVRALGITLKRAAWSGYPASSPVARVRTGGIETRLSHTVVGTIGEMLVAADLLARDFAVYFPLVRNASCDLVSVHRSTYEAERIEVRCGHRLPNGHISYSTPDKSKSDRRAIVIAGEPVTYSPPFIGDTRYTYNTLPQAP